MAFFLLSLDTLYLSGMLRHGGEAVREVGERQSTAEKKTLKMWVKHLLSLYLITASHHF